MAHWFYEVGIGENRAILVEDGRILEAAIELPTEIRAGSVVAARLTSILIPRRRGIAAFAGGEALVEPLPPALTQGAECRIEIVREAIAETGRAKLAKARVTEAWERAGASLRGRILASGHALIAAPAGSDAFEEAGWSELIEEAESGEIGFPGGALRMSVTPTMTLFDVDGRLHPDQLAIDGAAAAGLAIRRHGIAGSIGIDLPTLAAKEDRLAAAAALDAALPQPFERTAVNGFGFLQIVRRRTRASLPEIVQQDLVGAAARALLRRAEHCGGAGARTLHAAPKVIARLEASPGWIAMLSRRVGAEIVLKADPSLRIFAGHVHAANP